MKTQFEVFLGTGGVGKTTLAYSRALSLSKAGSKVFLMTIDPSHRLKDFIELNPHKLLTTQLFNSKVTFEKLLITNKLKATRLSNLIMSKYGGMNELLSLIELDQNLNSGEYDYVVLDTAPGHHFIDFLENYQNVLSFFSPQIIEFFQTSKTSKSYFKKAIDFGIDKVLGQLRKFTSINFLDEFVETLSLMYTLSQSFTQSIKTQKSYIEKDSRWFIVFNCEQTKFKETCEVFNKIIQDKKIDKIPLINRRMADNSLKPLQSSNKVEKEILAFYAHRQERLISGVEDIFKDYLIFDEVHGPNIVDHVRYLTKTWENYDL